MAAWSGMTLTPVPPIEFHSGVSDHSLAGISHELWGRTCE